MGDLISRKELLEVLTHCKELGRKSFASVIEAINDQPTISDKEIRDKAVEDFKTALLKQGVIDKSVVRRVAEQVKG